MLVEMGRARQIVKLILEAQVIQGEGMAQLLMGSPSVVAAEAPHLEEGEERHLLMVVAPTKTDLDLVQVEVGAVVLVQAATALPASS